MKLTITTPLEIVLDAEDVAHVRAEDSSGAFGILSGHADFLTVLVTSVIAWRRRDGTRHYVAVRGGVLEVHDGNRVAVATPEAVASDDLVDLESRVIAGFEIREAEEQAARSEAQRLYLAALRELARYLRPGRPRGLGNPAPDVRHEPA